MPSAVDPRRARPLSRRDIGHCPRVYWMSRDPDGCASISRSIGGVHDTAGGDRPALAKVRCKSLRGATSKFDVDECVRRDP